MNNNLRTDDTDIRAINNIKCLVMDTVKKANSGHTGGAFSSADFIYVLYKEFLSFDPSDPAWINRDRFVLSAGHESALLYSIFSFIGWLTTEDLKNFRQYGSRTPGHPEFGHTPGVDATTGPLGQGFGNAVGMAVAESYLSEIFGQDIINHHTYCLFGDGDIQESVSLGAASLAGNWGLNKLICFYDSNNAQISGKVSRADSNDYASIFRAMNWNVIEIDGHNLEKIREALKQAIAEKSRPTLIIGKTIMAKGSFSMEGSEETHGVPLPSDEIEKTKEKFGFAGKESFYIGKEELSVFRENFRKKSDAATDWKKKISDKLQDDLFRSEWERAFHNKDKNYMPEYYPVGSSAATREAFGKFVSDYGKTNKYFIGGSADLDPSVGLNKFIKEFKDYNSENRSGRNLAFGVREFPMGVINNGIALHGGLKSFGATFLVFSDYERPAVRMRALQGIPVISDFTHDSIFVGEDGPTHQPVEHIMALRAIPGLLVFRPADANETLDCCKIAFEMESTPSVMILSRQKLPLIERNKYKTTGDAEKGAYIISGSEAEPDIIIFATGSEVHTALKVKDMFTEKSISVVNVVSWELFDRQDKEYKESILNRNVCRRVSIEAGVTIGWQKFTGMDGLNIGIDSFGASGPAEILEDRFNLSANKVFGKIKEYYNI